MNHSNIGRTAALKGCGLFETQTDNTFVTVLLLTLEIVLRPNNFEG